MMRRARPQPQPSRARRRGDGVSLSMDGEVDLDKVNDWLGMLLNDRWQDLFRMKGVLAIEGCDDRYVFQGVHALFEGMPDRPWEGGGAHVAARVHREAAEQSGARAGFEACKVGAAAGAGWVPRETDSERREMMPRTTTFNSTTTRTSTPRSLSRLSLTDRR